MQNHYLRKNYKALWAALVVAMAPSTSFGAAASPPPEPKICAALRTDIESSEKEMSVISSRVLLENSAPRAMFEQAQINGEVGLIQANLVLMAQHHCAPFARPITTNDYILSATQCAADRLKVTIGTSPESCDRSKWLPVGQ